MRKTLREIADFIGGQLSGDKDIVITGISGIKEAHSGDVTFLANPKYFALLEKTQASAVIIPQGLAAGDRAVIRSENPSLAFAKLFSLLEIPQARHPQGIHPSAILGKDVVIAKGAAIGAYTVVADNSSIGEGAVIYPGCYIGQYSRIGKGSLIYPNVSIRERTTIGERVIIHSGTVIGSDGFGFIEIEGRHFKIPQLGTVEIGDDVEIGANVTIDRARFNKTVIAGGTKIDNLVQIAHNVTIGKNSVIVSQVGISGSTSIGENVVLAGQVGIVGHISVGNNAVVMAQSGVNKSIPAGSVFWGYPAKPAEISRKVNACVQNLPRLYQTIAQLKKKIGELEARLGKNKDA